MLSNYFGLKFNDFLPKAKKNKQVSLRPIFGKTDEAGMLLFFLSKKQMRPLFFISSKTNEAPFFVHYKSKNVDILILTCE